MDHQRFIEVFDHAFAKPLFDQGFSFLDQGRTLQFLSGNRELRLIRLGGRFERPGMWRSAVCFRHTFLRPIHSEDPNQKNLGVEDFSRKLAFDDFNGWIKPRLNYRPGNSGRWKLHDFQYENSNEHDVEMRLHKLVSIMKNRVLPWVNTLTEASELVQIKEYGEHAWCEKRWIEDYEGFLLKKPQ